MNRRMRRQMERDVKKKGKMLNIPTEEDIMNYINDKLKDNTNVQLQETGWGNTSDKRYDSTSRTDNN